MPDEPFRRRNVLAISQVYPPDPTSLGQHMADAASAVAQRGHHVTVLTANRGYEDPTLRYPSQEFAGGVTVRRLPLSSFGKHSIFARLAGGLSFLAQILIRGALERGVDTILVSTSPPMAGLAGVLLARWKGARLVYWVMDVNPDQAVALGMASRGGLAARGYEWMNRVVLRRADDIVVLDRFMERRILDKFDVRDRLHVIAPWAHEDHITPQPRAENRFRDAHGLRDKFVVMYSGNHAISSPLRTIIDAALALQDDPHIVFVFVGGGTGKREVEAAGARNIVSLPYEPLDALSYSLGAADLHVVTMRDDMVGIVHPCKVYGALAAARPVLFVGPRDSHLADLIDSGSLGWHIAHGDVAGAEAAIRSAAALSDDQWSAMSRNARSAIDAHFSKQSLCSAFCDIVAGVEPPTLTSGSTPPDPHLFSPE
jgi:glycosyltransferase involved in cell wall biosynthesis